MDEDKKPEEAAGQTPEADKPTEEPTTPEPETAGSTEPATEESAEESSETEDVVNDAEKPTDEPEKVEPIATSEPVVMHEKWYTRAWYWLKARKKITIPAGVVVLLLLLAAVPFTRYVFAGMVLKSDFAVEVADTKTGRPITNVTVALDGKSVKTDNKGLATLHVKVGHGTLSTTKKYYTSSDVKVLVPIGSSKQPYDVKMTATGRQVPVTVLNKITGKPVENALVRAADTEAKTDAKGLAVIVLPADKATLPAEVSGTGFNDTNVTIDVTDQTVKQNSLQITPSGKVYFLSKLSGTIDVVKTNLDGTDRQTVLAGTGNEDDSGTVLLASRDWKYLALLSQRDTSGQPKLYLITTATDKLTEMDSGNATFSLVGWSGSTFVYSVTRNNVQNWEPNGQAIKTYDASAGKLSTIDQTTGEGTSDGDYYKTTYGQVFEFGNELDYTLNVEGTASRLSGKSANLMSINVDGSSKKTVKSFPIPNGYNYSYAVYAEPYDADGIYVEVYDGNNDTYYEYDNDKLTTANITNAQFYSGYPTYLQSPSGNQTFWSEARDGKNTLFVGDDDGKNGKQIATLSDYNTYGWYTNDYLLVSKDSSELYVMPVGGGTALKISDYHKPQNSYPGYGGGYGGL